MATKKKRIYFCDLCHRREAKTPGTYWCDCNPPAPFRMMDEAVVTNAVRMTNAMLTRLIGHPPEGVS